MINSPLISIITPTLNQGKFITQTIESVLTQDYPHVEYIVVDGGSTDETLNILKSYGDSIKWISEPDRGQADAINKGFTMAKGEILAWVNSDDLLTRHAIRYVMSYFAAHPEAHFIYGDALALDQDGKPYGIRAHVRQMSFDELIGLGDLIVQPAAFWRRTLWESVGTLDSDLRYALDYEYWMRVAKSFHMQYIPVCLAQERLHASALTFKGSLRRVQEIERSARKHGGDGLPLYFRGEAAAIYTLEALKAVRKRRWSDARAYLREARQTQASLRSFLRYFGVISLFGYSSLVWIWLRLNVLRASVKSATKFPAEVI